MKLDPPKTPSKLRKLTMKGILAVLGRALVLTTALLTIVNTSRADSGGYTVTLRGPDYKILQKTTVEHGTNQRGPRKLTF